MLSRLLILIALLCALGGAARADDAKAPDAFDQFLAGVGSADSGGAVPFSPTAFAEAQHAGKIILLHFNAFWCSTCGAQRPILSDVLSTLQKDPEFGDLTVFTVDFDQQKDVVQRFGVQMQSTIVVFRGSSEIGRTLGTTDAATIKALLLKAKAGDAGAAGSSSAKLLSGGSYVLAILAGLLSVLSPCVLPLLPIVIGGATTAHRWGALMLSAGVALSFVAVGVFVATVGLGIGLDRESIRLIAASLMIVFGMVLLSGPLQERLALIGVRLEGAADRLMRWMAPSGLRGQFVVGLLLGGVWSPCIGPTLGAAITLAGERQTDSQAFLVMLLFGLGVAVPLVAIGLLSHQVMLRWRERIEVADHVAKIVLGVLILGVGAAILIGADRDVETFLLGLSPAWLTRLPTLY